jgi:tight adherence protein C
MDELIWIFSIGTFTAVTLCSYGLITYVRSRRVVRDRFKSGSSAMPLWNKDIQDNSLKRRFMDWVSSLGKYAMSDKEDASRIRSTLIMAGFRNARAVPIYYGLRALGAVAFPMPYLMGHVIDGKMASGNLGVGLMLAGLGFYLPQYVLRYMSRARQDRIDKGLPDVLDLIIVCMEAGLSLQATLNRVSDEIRTINKDLYHELQITNGELRTGIPRDVALKNLGDRCGAQNVKALTAMMVQSEKLGASIVQALRTHASFLRVQRGQRAEERAAKLPVKILFPMILFIFPAIFIVVMGPAVIQLLKSPVLGEAIRKSAGL